MSVQIPDKLKDLLERPIVSAFATLMPGGGPQITPVWFMFDGEHIIVNTARGRQKDKNLSVGANVALSIIDPQNPYHWAELRGVVAEETEENAHADIKRLSLKYRGKEEYALQPNEVRVTYKIAIKKVNGN